jgi:NAD(P)-dependent dehydrogenase (short-subunit alcohol dehydrogenase family)
MSDDLETTAPSPRDDNAASDRGESALPRLDTDTPRGAGTRRLGGKLAIVCPGDGRTGRAIALGLAREGADVAIIYHDGHEAAQETMGLIAGFGRATMAVSGDIGNAAFCADAIEQVVMTLGPIDALVIASDQTADRPEAPLADASDEDLEHMFRRQVFGPLVLARATLARLRDGGAIVNTTGAPAVSVEQASVEAAIIGMARSLARAVAARCIRVNVVLPGSTDPEPIVPICVFLVGDEGRSLSGEVFHAGPDTEIDA